MKRTGLILFSVFSLLGGGGVALLWLLFAMDPVTRYLANTYVFPVSLLGLLSLAGNIYTLIVTKAFSRRNDVLPGNVKTIAVASWVLGGGLLTCFAAGSCFLLYHFFIYSIGTSAP